MKLLLIAYYFPPMGGAGVQRALKFSKYLPEFGVHPVVLTADVPDYVSDASLASEIPAGLPVVRVPHRPLLQRLLSWRRKRSAAVQEGRAAAPVAGASMLRAGVRDALLKTYAALQFPDDKAGWARGAWQRARHILRNERVDLILSSSPPVSAHRLAARLSKEFGVPWVADYRDLWTEISSHDAPAWRRALDRRMEARWLRQAAGLVTVTPAWAQMMAQRVGPRCPVAFIPNGYDEADFRDLRADARPGDEVTLVHTGTFYGPRDPAAFLDGVELFLRQAAPQGRRLRVRLVGNMGTRFADRLQQFEAEHPGVIECVPYLPHRAALGELMRADALLLVVGGWHGAAGAGLLPGKIFEYLRAAKPVLLLGPSEGAAAQLIRDHGSGWIVDEAQPQEIARALHALVEGERAAVQGDGDTERFERRELSRQLAAFLVRCKEAHGRA